jgi:hypothetical protein
VGLCFGVGDGLGVGECLGVGEGLGVGVGLGGFSGEFGFRSDMLASSSALARGMDFTVINATPFRTAKKRILRKRELKMSLDFIGWARSSEPMIVEFSKPMQGFFLETMVGNAG